jgi:hypothetical protein
VSNVGAVIAENLQDHQERCTLRFSGARPIVGWHPRSQPEGLKVAVTQILRRNRVMNGRQGKHAAELNCLSSLARNMDRAHSVFRGGTSVPMDRPCITQRKSVIVARGLSNYNDQRRWGRLDADRDCRPSRHEHVYSFQESPPREKRWTASSPPFLFAPA